MWNYFCIGDLFERKVKICLEGLKFGQQNIFPHVSSLLRLNISKITLYVTELFALDTGLYFGSLKSLNFTLNLPQIKMEANSHKKALKSVQ